MNRTLIAGTFLLLACGTFAALFLSRPPDAPPEPPAPPHETVQSRPVAGPAQAEPTSRLQPEPTVRERLSATQRDPASFAQGVKGRVVDPAGSPVASATVWLVPGFGAGEILALAIAQQRGTSFPPLARVETDAMGSFAVGIERPGEPAVTEVRVLATGLSDGKVANLRIAAGEWHDVGTVQLARGLVVEGTVRTADGDKTPVAGASVSLRPQGNQLELALVPGREQGLTTLTDEQGRYRIDAAPAGIVTLGAVARGFALSERQGFQLSADAVNRCDFEMLAGREIAGTVVDAKGNKIASAQVTATAISTKTPVFGSARSDRDGAFEIRGLVDGAYQLVVVGDGFARADIKPVAAGTADLQITLEKLGAVQVQVYGKTGRLLSEYDVTVRTVLPGQEVYGGSQVPPKHVRTRAGEPGTIEGLEAITQDYVLQVEAKEHSRAFSAPFKVVVGQQPPLLTVRLDEGGVIEGRVLGKTGAPQEGVQLETLAFAMPAAGIFTHFAKAAPSNITKSSVRTGADGKFRIPLLNPGKYFLELTHPEHFDVTIKDLEVTSGQTLTLPDVRLQGGTLVAGIVRVDGAPAGQARVTISTVSQPDQQVTSSFYGEATTSGNGGFKVSKRLPPGRYQAAASRSNVDPFTGMFDFSRSKTEFVVDGSQGEVVVDILIPTR